MTAGRRSLLVVKALNAAGKAMNAVAVRVHGAGLDAIRRTNAAGAARFSVRPTSPGVVRISLLQAASCGNVSQLGHVLGAFMPPKPNFTG